MKTTARLLSIEGKIAELCSARAPHKTKASEQVRLYGASAEAVQQRWAEVIGSQATSHPSLRDAATAPALQAMSVRSGS
jgi:hypothetical protein